MWVRLRQCVRGGRLALHTLAGLAASLCLVLDPCRSIDAPKLMSWWCRDALRIIGIEFEVEGKPLDGSRLMVANHVSWIDILLIGACQPARFVAKSEIANWPVAGWLARSARSFFIKRGHHESLRLAKQLTRHLERNGAITLFPEGTTTPGTVSPRFHARLFSSAIEAQALVQPIAISHGLSDSGENIAAFVDDDNLLSHLLKILGQRRLSSRLVFLQPIHPSGKTRRQLASESAGLISASLASGPTVFDKPNVANRVAHPGLRA